MKYSRIVLVVLIALAAVGLGGQRALGQAAAPSGPAYPKAQNNYVNDFAGVMQAPDVEQLKKTLEKLERDTGIEGTVVTVVSYNYYGTGEPTIERFTTNLFNHWGVGQKKTNKGFMVLVGVMDRKCRIELGKGFGTGLNAKMKEIIDQKMVPYFRNSDYNRGIYEGTMAVVGVVAKPVPWYQFYMWELIGGVASCVLLLAGVSLIKSGRRGWGWAIFALAFGLIMSILFSVFNSKGDSDSFGGGSSDGEGGASGDW